MISRNLVKVTKLNIKNQITAAAATSLQVQPTAVGNRNYFSVVDKDKKKKPKVLVLGSGWSSFAFLKKLNSKYYDITLISPRNHFLFTPLLASTTVGTLEFRSIAEPIRKAKNDFEFLQAQCTTVDPETKTIECTSTLHDTTPFKLQYDYLVIGVGARNATFGIPGVSEHAHFLKELHQARSIRQRIIYCFESASLPDCKPEERKRLLSTIIVGAGPTGVEFAAELNDLVIEDIAKLFPNVPCNEINITILEASNRILSAFDSKLVDTAVKRFRTTGIDVRTNTIVKEVLSDEVILTSGERIPFGLLVWSTGIGSHPFTDRLPMEKDKHGRIIVDDFLRVKNIFQNNNNNKTIESTSTTSTITTTATTKQQQQQENIYSFGDCASPQGNNNNLPATAQVAQQEGYYLAQQFNNRAENKELQPFVFNFLGIMAYIGRMSSLFQTNSVHASGFTAWVTWRSAYLTRLGSIRSKLQVPFDWARTFIFGRDISNF
ncbi:putative NADH dehydrogenase [Cavenderia fasciculata]|uniref:NADH dehydrogenase n=1 Tax=Cavenderia fasciculata TaxID=261658 RepID=F4PQ58_CACFS|nr:putative NADH dehydrogenase [Cavenderia fasciculata]EGG22521.1 putative NADH dehydrogenase [Cavenderia fasciculata]|eukprot:XP_004360372.1 putative NADH dehydrogenase [Cavenderia fasciculata]